MVHMPPRTIFAKNGSEVRAGRVCECVCGEVGIIGGEKYSSPPQSSLAVCFPVPLWYLLAITITASHGLRSVRLDKNARH
jgi:hypothetical protein